MVNFVPPDEQTDVIGTLRIMLIWLG
jgi:hypothetical protein